jgi:hypothetical protein
MILMPLFSRIGFDLTRGIPPISRAKAKTLAIPIPPLLHYPERVKKSGIFLILLLFFQNLTPLSSYGLGLCECPQSDALVDPGCSKEPPSVEKNIFPTPTCNIGAIKPYGDQDWLFGDILQDYHESLGSTLSPKSKPELLSYLRCYLPSDKDKALFCHYKNSLSPYIMRACRATGFPFVIESCLLFKESGFQKGSVSGAGATGYGQLTSGVLTEINAGCVEAAMMAGLSASQAFCGYPEKILGMSKKSTPG